MSFLNKFKAGNFLYFGCFWFGLAVVVFSDKTPSIPSKIGGVIGLMLWIGIGWSFLCMARKYEFLLRASQRERQHLQDCLAHAKSASFAFEDQTNRLLKWGPEAVAIHRRGELIYLSQAALKLFQVPPETTLLGTPLLNLVHSDFQNDEAERWLQCIHTFEDAQRYETHYVRLDGLQMLVEVVHRTVTLAGEVALQTYFRDITKEREDALTLSRLTRDHKTLRGAVERHSLLVKMDISGDILYVNDPFVMLCGYASEQLIGKAYGLLRSPAQSQTVWNAMWMQISAGRAWQGELCLKRRNGAQKWVNVLISPFFNDGGVIESYTLLQTDITEFVEAKQLARDRLLGNVAT